MPTVTVHPGADGGDIKTVDVPSGTTLFDAGAKLAAGIDTACVGKGTCGLCRVRILVGGESLNPITDEEKKHLGNVYHITKVRLSCRTLIGASDVAIEVVRKKRK